MHARSPAVPCRHCSCHFFGPAAADAAQLAADCPPGEVLVQRSVSRAAGGRFNFAPHAPRRTVAGSGGSGGRGSGGRDGCGRALLLVGLRRGSAHDHTVAVATEAAAAGFAVVGAGVAGGGEAGT